MFNMRHTIALATCLCLLQACGPLTIRDDATGAYVPLQPGAFALHKDVAIRAEHTRAYLQYGKLVGAVNEFESHCQLEVNTLRDTPQTIQADDFTVTRITTRTRNVVQAAPVHLAALDGFTLAHFGGLGGIGGIGHNDGESSVMYAFEFSLHSDRQPDVRALRCGGAFDEPGLAKQPTLQEIAEALGAYGTLSLR